MQKNSITNKITPCCSLPFGVVYWWVSNLNLNTEADRQFIISKISQSGTISIDAWKVLINSGELEADASLTKAEFLAWFDCDRPPSCSQLKLIIEGLKVGNYNPADEYGVGWTEQSTFEEYGEKIIKKITGYVGGIGDIPSELQLNIGKYYAAAGGFTTDKALATDFKNSNGLTLTDLSQPYFLSNSSISGNSAHDVEFQAVGGQRYYFNNTFFTVDKFVTTAKMYSVGAGSITFALGLLDQNNKFIERKDLTFTTVAGMNTYNFNELLKANERIAVKCPITNGMCWINHPANDGVMWETSSYQASATPTPSNTIALELNIFDYEENPFVFRTEFEDLQSEVEILKNKPVTVVGDNGTPYFIKVDSNGDLYAKSAVYQKIAHLGHSFTIHEITPFWWGTYGMAASKRENDYVHRFWDKYKAINPSVTNAAYSVKAWEQMENTSGYNFSQINSTIANADVIFIKVGENISYPSMATFESNLNGLVDYIKGQRPTADIVLVGQIWQNATKEAVLTSVATNKNLIYISMAGVDIPANRASVNDYVLGDDNVLHQISEGGAIAQGVADHLGDAGHEIVATKLMQGLGL